MRGQGCGHLHRQPTLQFAGVRLCTRLQVWRPGCLGTPTDVSQAYMLERSSWAYGLHAIFLSVEVTDRVSEQS